MSLSALAALSAPTTQSYINQKLNNITIEEIKNTFKLTELFNHLLHEMESTDYDENENIFNFSSTELLAVLLYGFYSIKSDFNEFVNNEALTDSLNYQISRAELSDLLSVNEIKNNLLHARGSNNLYYVYIEFIKLIYKSVKSVNKRTTNSFKNPSHLKIVLISHEFFDSFKSALDDYLIEFNNGDIEGFKFNDIDSIPYHKLKTSIVPRNQSVNSLFYNFIYSDLDNHYTHQIQDFQPEEFNILQFDDSLDQLLLNLINDCNFYIRFFPTNWINGTTTPTHLLEANNYNLHASNNTLKCILKRHQIN